MGDTKILIDPLNQNAIYNENSNIQLELDNAMQWVSEEQGLTILEFDEKSNSWAKDSDTAKPTKFLGYKILLVTTIEVGWVELHFSQEEGYISSFETVLNEISSRNAHDQDLSECITFSFEQVYIDNFTVTDGNEFSIEFDNLSDAEYALKVINYYKLDEYCWLDDAFGFSYFLSNGVLPANTMATPTLENEDCIPIKVNEFVVTTTHSGYPTVVNPLTLQWAFAAEKTETAEKILKILNYYRPTNSCFVGRPNSPMEYLKR